MDKNFEEMIYRGCPAR